MNDTVSGGNHHKSDDAQSSPAVDMPDSITAAIEAAAATATDLINAEIAYDAAYAEYQEANNRWAAAEQAQDAAREAEKHAHSELIVALRAYGWVLTADGPRPRDHGQAIDMTTGKPERS